jgi:hypothetical protein
MFNQQHQARRILFLVSILLGAWLVGCNGGCQSPSIVDAPASNVDVKLVVMDITETPSDGKVICAMQFTQGGTVIQMASNIALSCNGVALLWNGLLVSHAERIPIQPVGGTYVFRFVRGGATNTATVTVPPRPVFAAPTIAGATLARTNNFTIHYIAGTGTSVRGDASDATNSKNDSQPDDGTHNALDVSGFSAGPGTLSITRTLEGTLTGTGFLSAKTKYDTNKLINITWQ